MNGGAQLGVVTRPYNNRQNIIVKGAEVYRPLRTRARHLGGSGGMPPQKISGF